MAKKVKILEIHANIDGEDVSVTVDFMDGFMEANTQTKASMLLCMMDVLGTFMHDHGADILSDAHDDAVKDTIVREVEEEAAAFLKRCVQNHGGRMQ